MGQGWLKGTIGLEAPGNGLLITGHIMGCITGQTEKKILKNKKTYIYNCFWNKNKLKIGLKN